MLLSKTNFGHLKKLKSGDSYETRGKPPCRKCPYLQLPECSKSTNSIWRELYDNGLVVDAPCIDCHNHGYNSFEVYQLLSFNESKSDDSRLLQRKDTICVKIVGIGGAGNNFINRMVKKAMPVDGYIAIGTDGSALKVSGADDKLQIGKQITGGHGSNSKPKIGRLAAESDRERIAEAIKGCDWLFLVAGMGGGTGTGAAPVIADVARSMGVSTAAIVTMPFGFEGCERMAQAEKGIEWLREAVDSLTIIRNSDYIDDTHTFANVFSVIDAAIAQKIKSIVADIRPTIMKQILSEDRRSNDNTELQI